MSSHVQVRQHLMKCHQKKNSLIRFHRLRSRRMSSKITVCRKPFDKPAPQCLPAQSWRWEPKNSASHRLSNLSLETGGNQCLVHALSILVPQILPAERCEFQHWWSFRGIPRDWIVHPRAPASPVSWPRSKTCGSEAWCPRKGYTWVHIVMVIRYVIIWVYTSYWSYHFLLQWMGDRCWRTKQRQFDSGKHACPLVCPPMKCKSQCDA